MLGRVSVILRTNATEAKLKIDAREMPPPAFLPAERPILTAEALRLGSPAHARCRKLGRYAAVVSP